MKNILIPFLAVLSMIALQSCKQEAKTDNAAKAEELIGTKGEARKAMAAAEGATAIMKSAVQGRWKPKNEPEGTEYTINDKIIQRYVNGKLDFSSVVEYGSSCGITCGGMSKKYRDAAGCLTINGQQNMCLVIQGFTTTRIDFVRLGDPNAPTETWEKI
jgi:hypothetical protein